ncbi:sliding clamp [uncultured Caudovirales phage]|uniref:Sliding clamp n=1 Tax=uncultured Caudovirales phage TaxID=2100421 RepID=A0A6J5M3K0_9CAUD|nr:sliding clamp [uncultured Caudovirales phage]
MKLSSNTLKVLKNFSEINNTIYIRKDSPLLTVDAQKRIVADVTLETAFPETFAIYNLNEFLAVNSAQDNAELTFEGDKIVFVGSGGKGRLEYFYSDPSTVQDPMNTRKKIPTVFYEDSVVMRFTLSDEELRCMRQNASLLSLTHISFVGEDNSVKVVIQDLSSRSSQNKFTLNVDGTATQNDTYNMLFENLKVLPDSYDVGVSPTVAHFKGKTTGAEYWIVMEAK